MTGTRFGTGVTSLPLGLRLALTVPVVVVELLLARTVVLVALSDDPRPAALVLLFMGAIAAITGPFLREIWRSTAEWRYGRARTASAARDDAERLRERAPLERFDPFTASSPPDDSAARRGIPPA